MRITFACLLLFSFAWFCCAQEYWSAEIPAGMFKPVPDAARYRFFLRHVATFERLALGNEAKGQSADALRNHFVHKFGLTRAEQQTIATIALAYDSDLASLHAQQKQIVDSFKAEHFPSGGWPKGQPAPAPPPELKALRGQIDALTLQTRDRVHAALGDARFANLDSMLRTHGVPFKTFVPTTK